MMDKKAAIHEINVRGIGLFGNDGSFDEWLDAPNWVFNFETPRQLIGSDRHQQVLQRLEELEYGTVA